MPVYLLTVRKWSTTLSAALIIPLNGIQAVASSLSGYYISWKGRYGEVTGLGYICSTLGARLHCMFSRITHPVAIVFVLMVEGVGVGCVFQSSESIHIQSTSNRIHLTVRFIQKLSVMLKF